MAKKENAKVVVYNTHTEVEAGKYVSKENCIADETVNMKNIIEDNVAVESDMHHIEPLEVLHGTLPLEGYEMRCNSDCLLKIILSNIEDTNK